MKKTILVMLIIVSLILTGCALNDTGFSRDTLIANQDLAPEVKEIATTTTTVREIVKISTGEWAPYVSEQLLNGGFTTEIIKAAFDKVDIDVELEYMNWNRAFELVDSAQYFGTYPWSYTEERRATFLYSDSFTSSGENFFYLKGNSKVPSDFTGFDSIRDLKVGGVESYSHVVMLEGEGIEVDVAGDDVESFSKLLNGRVDIIPANLLVGQGIIDSNFTSDKDKFAYLKSPLSEMDMGLIVSKDYPDGQRLIDKFNEGFSKLRATGEYNQILEKHGYGFLVAESESSVDVTKTYDPIDPIVITTGEYGPYVSESLNEYGFNTEIIVRAFELTNVDVEIQFHSWTKAKTLVDDNLVFGSFPWVLTPERLEIYKFTDPMVSTNESFFYLKNNSNIPSGYDFTTYKDLSQFKVGGQKDFFYLEDFEVAGIKPDMFEKEVDGLNKLINGRMDLYPGNILVTMELLKSEFADDLENIAWFNTPFSSADMAIMTNPNYPNGNEYIERFNEGLAMLIESGEFKKIHEKHGFGFLVEDTKK